jgi:hypothetical protein
MCIVDFKVAISTFYGQLKAIVKICHAIFSVGFVTGIFEVKFDFASRKENGILIL